MLPFSISAPWTSYGQISLSVETECLHLHCCLGEFFNVKIFQIPFGYISGSVVLNFTFFQQQDAVEILACIFEVFCVESLHAQHMLFKLRNEITCSTCFNDSSNEESSSLLQLAVSNCKQFSTQTIHSTVIIVTLLNQPLWFLHFQK